MKTLVKFQAENHKSVKSIDESKQSSFKGGRFLSGDFMNMEAPIQRTSRKPFPFSGKVFNSLSDLRAFMLGGK